MIQAEISQLEAGAFSNVSGQQTQSDIRPRGESTQQIRDARQHAPGPTRKLLAQVPQVGASKAIPILRRILQLLGTKQISRNTSIRASTSGDVIGWRTVEDLDERQSQRFQTGTAGIDQSPIDIEQHHMHGMLISAISSPSQQHV
jgi:hypothetical protein